jgi:hypothetical protein
MTWEAVATSGWGTFHGRGKGSGAEFDVPMAWVYIAEETEDELLIRYEAYFDREKALESLGLDRWPEERAGGPAGSVTPSR